MITAFRSSKRPFSFKLQNQHCVPANFSLFSMRGTGTARLILTDQFFLTKFDTEYKVSNCALSRYPYSAVTASFFGPDIFLSILFSATLSLCSSHTLGAKVSHMCKTTNKLYFCVL